MCMALFFCYAFFMSLIKEEKVSTVLSCLLLTVTHAYGSFYSLVCWLAV